MLRKLATKIALVLVVATAGVVGAVTPAQASGWWSGDCSRSRSGNLAAAFCDGNGPDYGYQVLVWCSNGNAYWGLYRWAGDTRGSAYYCPSPWATAARVYVYYLGNVIKTIDF